MFALTSLSEYYSIYGTVLCIEEIRWNRFLLCLLWQSVQFINNKHSDNLTLNDACSFSEVTILWSIKNPFSDKIVSENCENSGNFFYQWLILEVFTNIDSVIIVQELFGCKFLRKDTEILVSSKGCEALSFLVAVVFGNWMKLIQQKKIFLNLI